MILEGSILVTISTSLLQGDLGRLPFTQYARELETCINSHIEGSDIECHYTACPSQWSTPINTKAFPMKSMTLKDTKCVFQINVPLKTTRPGTHTSALEFCEYTPTDDLCIVKHLKF